MQNKSKFDLGILLPIQYINLLCNIQNDYEAYIHGALECMGIIIPNSVFISEKYNRSNAERLGAYMGQFVTFKAETSYYVCTEEISNSIIAVYLTMVRA